MRNVNLKEENFAGTLKKSLLIIALIWTAAVALSLFWNISQIKENVINEAYSDAKMASHKDVLYRQWGARHSGVYVPVTPETPPNPYLSHIPERDITTPSGKKLTLVNPAYMTRQVYELEGRKYGLIGHLTSPRPISPQNAPDEWEKKAFLKISQGENGFFSVLDMNGTKVLRLMTPFFVEESCMACHARQGLPARIILKMNSLAEPQAIAALYRASQAGVKIDLIVRGICCLRPGVPGLSENITVRSIVDRFLEHSRIFYFENACQPQVFISSADWLPRNFFRRIELAIPVEDGVLRERLIHEVLAVSLADTVKARALRADGSYHRVRMASGAAAVRSQARFIALAAGEDPAARPSAKGKPRYPRVTLAPPPFAPRRQKK